MLRHAAPIRRSAGRWSALPAAEPDSTVRAHFEAELLLGRYGVLTRGAVAAENVPGGFAMLYKVLTALEDAGRCQRGYFVESLGGAQFSTAATVDRLRTYAGGIDSGPARERAETTTVVLAASDPANPYGAALPWPMRDADNAHRPGRKAGALVALVDGELAWFLERGGRSLLSFTADPQVNNAAAAALADLVTGRRLDSTAGGTHRRCAGVGQPRFGRRPSRWARPVSPGRPAACGCADGDRRMPEGDTVFHTAAALRDALDGKTLTRCDVRVPRFAAVDLTGERVDEVLSRGKHLFIRVGAASIHSHLKMDGSWQIGRVRAAAYKMRIVLAAGEVTASGVDLGVLEILERAHDLDAVAHLGPDLLGPDWAADVAAAEPDGRAGPAASRGAAGSAGDGRRRERVRQRAVLRVRPAARPARRALTDPLRVVSPGATDVVGQSVPVEPHHHRRYPAGPRTVGVRPGGTALPTLRHPHRHRQRRRACHLLVPRLPALGGGSYWPLWVNCAMVPYCRRSCVAASGLWVKVNST